jgi:hypothetical protein
MHHSPLLPGADLLHIFLLQMGALGEAAPLTRQQHLKRIRYMRWSTSWLLALSAPCSDCRARQHDS